MRERKKQEQPEEITGTGGDEDPQREAGTERDRLKAILDSMDDGIYIVGRDLRIKFMNLALKGEMGDGEGECCFEFFGHERSACDECQHGMSSFGPRMRREWFSPKTRRTYDVSVSPLHEPDGGIARIHILRDITERKELEARLQEYSQQLEARVAEQSERLLRQERLTLLGEISAGLAHEVRTPLGAVITGIKLVEMEGQSPEERSLIFDLLKRETARLERKLSEFLTYAKPRLPRPVDVSVPSLLEDIRTLLSTDRSLVGDVAVKIAIDPELGLWPLDLDQIKEALLNIGMNALQAMHGTGTITIEARSHGDALHILIRDNGPGIGADALPHIFKPFYSSRPEGTGLGLAISKEIVESHGGSITVSSVAGLNTTFRITLPRR